MPSHIHTPPQCSTWTGHDRVCFDQEFGAEVDCVLIELGKNKGSYLCIHKRAPETRKTETAAISVAQAARQRIIERTGDVTLSDEWLYFFDVLHGADLEKAAALRDGARISDADK